MAEALVAIMPFMIPILGILLGFTVVVGIFIVQPLTKALTQIAERSDLGPASVDGRFAALEDRMAAIEGSLQRLAAAQEFDRSLGSGATREE